MQAEVDRLLADAKSDEAARRICVKEVSASGDVGIDSRGRGSECQGRYLTVEVCRAPPRRDREGRVNDMDAATGRMFTPMFEPVVVDLSAVADNDDLTQLNVTAYSADSGRPFPCGVVPVPVCSRPLFAKRVVNDLVTIDVHQAAIIPEFSDTLSAIQTLRNLAIRCDLAAGANRLVLPPHVQTLATSLYPVGRNSGMVVSMENMTHMASLLCDMDVSGVFNDTGSAGSPVKVLPCDVHAIRFENYENCIVDFISVHVTAEMLPVMVDGSNDTLSGIHSLFRIPAGKATLLCVGPALDQPADLPLLGPNLLNLSSYSLEFVQARSATWRSTPYSSTTRVPHDTAKTVFEALSRQHHSGECGVILLDEWAAVALHAAEFGGTWAPAVTPIEPRRLTGPFAGAGADGGYTRREEARADKYPTLIVQMAGAVDPRSLPLTRTECAGSDTYYRNRWLLHETVSNNKVTARGLENSCVGLTEVDCAWLPEPTRFHLGSPGAGSVAYMVYPAPRVDVYLPQPSIRVSGKRAQEIQKILQRWAEEIGCVDKSGGSWFSLWWLPWPLRRS